MTKAYIIDDDHLYLTILSTKLWQAGYTVKTFESVDMAIPHLNETPDIIILGHNFFNSEAKGFDYLSKIKRTVSRRAGIIHITSESSPAVINEYIKRGVDRHLEKDKELFVKIDTVIRELLSERKSRGQNFWNRLLKLFRN